MSRIGNLLLIAFLLFPMLSEGKEPVLRDRRNCTAPLIVGGVIDYRSRLGKEQKIAMEVAAFNFNLLSNCSNQALLSFAGSEGNSTQVVSAAIKLTQNKHAKGVVGQISLQEATLVSILDNTRDVPFISITSPTIFTNHQLGSNQFPFYFQMGDAILNHVDCLSAIIGHFKWKSLAVIYEQRDGMLSGSQDILTLLSNSLQMIGSEISYEVGVSGASFIQAELVRLKRKSHRIFVVLQSSMEMAIEIFKVAKKLGMLETGYAWIITDEIASCLDSVNSSVFESMQGIIGFKQSISTSHFLYKRFKSNFQRRYESSYPEEKESSNPSTFAMRAYDGTWAMLQAMSKTQMGKSVTENMLASDFNGLTGRIRFNSGNLLSKNAFDIINVVGISYRVLAGWSDESGFFHIAHGSKGSGKNGSAEELDSVLWPGGMTFVPKDWFPVKENKLLRIGVPAKGVCPPFVKVSVDQTKNATSITGFSIELFEAMVQRLPYPLPYELVPYDGSYDDLLLRVRDKVFDGAAGDLGILADRYQHVEFTQPYVDSSLVMVVPTKTDDSIRNSILKAFSGRMWATVLALHVFIGFCVWLIEEENNVELKGIGKMLWFSVTLVIFAQKAIRSNWSRLILAPWLFAILILSMSFSAVLSSILTVNRMKPSVVDIEMLQRFDAPIGCNAKSFFVRYLSQVLHFKNENIITFSSVDDYPYAFDSGQIQAAFLVELHAKVFLAKYCSGFTLAGPSHRLGGLGFAFQKGSPLAEDLSLGILKATDTGEVKRLEDEMLRSLKCITPNNLDGDMTLDYKPFRFLLFTSGSIAILVFIVIISKKLYRISPFVRTMTIGISSGFSFIRSAFITKFSQSCLLCSKKIKTAVEGSSPSKWKQ